RAILSACLDPSQGACRRRSCPLCEFRLYLRPMKTKRRHELHTNALADWLAGWVDAARAYFGWLGCGGIAGIVILLGWSYFSSRSQTQMYDGWSSVNRSTEEAMSAVFGNDGDKFQSATTSLAKIVTEYSGTPLAAFAESSLGDVHMLRGQNLMWV